MRKPCRFESCLLHKTLPLNIQTIIQNLNQYIYYSPDSIKKCYYNGSSIDDDNWINNNIEAVFKGLLFKDGKVMAMKLYTFAKSEDYKPRYIEVTKVMEMLLNDFNPLHAAICLSEAIKKHSRESTLTENIIPYLKYDKKYHLPKFRHHITKHHNRHRKFCESYPSENRRVWDKILYKSASEIGYNSSFDRERDQRPSSLFITYSCQPKLCVHKTNIQHTQRVSGTRKPRRRHLAFNPKKR